MSNNKSIYININLKENQYFEIDRYLHLSENFVIKGGRGVGKTYSCIKKTFEDLFKEHRPFVYCRLSDREFKGIIGTISEIYSPEEILEKSSIDYNKRFKPIFVRGRPAKTITVKYRDSEGDLQYFLVCLLCDVSMSSNYKGYAPEKNKEPKWFVLDEFTNGINILTGDVELKTLDLIETYFRNRPAKVLLLTNNNNENNAFKDILNDCVFIKINKNRNTRTNNKTFNDYIAGNEIEYDTKHLKLIGYYYITSRDIVGIYNHVKLNILLMKQENFEKTKNLAKKDKDIFSIECQFVDEWCQNVFRLAKKNMIKLYD